MQPFRPPLLHLRPLLRNYPPPPPPSATPSATPPSATTKGETVLSIRRYAQWNLPSTYLSYGDCIRIANPEINSYLWAHTSTVNGESKKPFFRRVSQSSHDHLESVEYERMVSMISSGAKSVFVIERLNKLAGGAVRWGDTIRFRHLVSGKYLMVSPHSKKKQVRCLLRERSSAHQS